MMPIEEFQIRSLSGPVMKEDEFDMALAMKVRELVARYKIKYDPQCIIVTDEIADAVFHAGVELLADIGIYNKDTFRVIRFSRDEVEAIARWRLAGPASQSFGKGKDEVIIKRRALDDPTPPATFFAASISPVPEEMFIPYAQSFAQEEYCQGFMGVPCSLESYKGLVPKVDTVSELTVAQAEYELTLEALRRAGKPNLQIGPTFIAVSPGAVASLIYPGGMESHNGMITIHIMPEQKMNWSRLVLAYIAQQKKIVPWTSNGSNMGLICRGPEDCAVVMVANLLAELGYGHGTISLGGATERDGSLSTRRQMWAQSAKQQAVVRNIGSLEGTPTPADAGAGTEMACYERAALVLNGIASGASWVFYPACRKGLGPGHTTGLEGRFMAETAHAVAGMNKDQANALMQKILSLFEPEKGKAPLGKTFFELYDMQTLQPLPEYLAVHQRAKEKLAALGVPYRH